MEPQRLKTWLTLLGVVNIVAFATYAVISYGLTPVMSLDVMNPAPRKAEIFGKLAQMIGFLGPGAQSFVSGQCALIRRGVFLLLYSLPLLISTGVFLALLILLARYHRDLESSTPKSLFRWAVIFAAISVLASPTLVQDFWLSLAWGRMVAVGLNPYYTDLKPEFAQGFPLDYWFDQRMTYGPLWAVVAGIVMWLAGQHVLLATGLFKLLLAGAWVASLRVIWLLLQGRSLWHQCAGIGIFGWLPLSLNQTVADGHNDVFMGLFLLLWLYGLERKKTVWASLSLAASALIKYVTAPLFLLDLLHLKYSKGRRLLEYFPQIMAASVLMAVTLGLFYRSPDFFTPTVSMGSWHFCSPSDSINALGRLIGVNLKFLGSGVRAFFFLLPVYFIMRYTKQPSPEEFHEAVLAIISGMLFSVVGHVWPWFLLWVLGLIALIPGTALARWGLGVALVMPFPFLVWTIFPFRDSFIIPSLLLFPLVVLWFVFAPSRWFPSGLKTSYK